MSQQQFPVVRKEQCLSFKIHEAKELVGDLIHGCDPYASIMIDNKEEVRTKTVWNSKDPVWDLECFLELKPDFSSLAVVVWDENRLVKDIPLGKVTLSKHFLQQAHIGGGEQWMQLAAAETEGTVTGDVHLEISYYRPTTEIPKHTFSVNVWGARGLVPRDANGFSDPYIVLHMMPDLDAEFSCATKVAPKTLNPEYHEIFTFPFNLNENVEDYALHLSVWDWDRFSDHEFMGHLTVPLGPVLEAGTVNKWYPLLPMPATIKIPGAEGVEGKIISMIRPMIKRHSRKTSMNVLPQIKAGMSPDISKGKNFFKAFQSLPVDHSTRIDKPRGSIRVYFNFSESRILPRDYYTRILELTAQQNYFLASHLGKFCSNREEAARTLIKIFDHQKRAKEFLFGVIEQEVNATIDPNTIFRGNSMASKGLDVYMKLTAMPYLSVVLRPLVYEIITSRKSCEVDPTRLEKPEDLPKNWKNLMHFCEMAFDAVVNSATECPKNLCEVFQFMRRCVKRKFPENDTVEYTSISGFIFLRFFCPAILGPTLFSLWEEQIEKSQARALTLVAKTLQNLGNLVEFGYKEVYMKDMNPFILHRLDEIKKFIDKISLPNNLVRMNTGEIEENLDFPKECAHLYRHYQESRSKLAENVSEEHSELVHQLMDELNFINQILNDEDERIKKKKEIDKANRRSAANGLNNGEAKVSVKTLPQAATSLSALDSLLDDLENFNYGAGPTSPLSRSDSLNYSPQASPVLTRMDSTSSTSSTSSSSAMKPLILPKAAAIQKPAQPLPTTPTSQSQATAISPTPAPAPAATPVFVLPTPAPAPVLVQARSTSIPTAEPVVMRTNNIMASNRVVQQPSPTVFTPSPMPVAKIVPVPSTAKSSTTASADLLGLDALDDLLNDLNFAVAEDTSTKADTFLTPGADSLEAIIAQAAAAAQRASMSLNQKADTPSWSQPPAAAPAASSAPPSNTGSMSFNYSETQDDSSAIDDLLGDFDKAATEAIRTNETKNVCVYCQRVIDEQNCHSWAGLKWHHGHFKCSVCDCSLEGTKFFYHDEKLFCVADFQKEFTCASCGLHISDAMAEALGRKYHTACFCCSMCENPLVGTFHIDEEGHLYCKEDWVLKSGMICTTCSKGIQGSFVTAGAHKHHPECFTCQECGVSLGGREYVVNEGRLQCAAHFRCAACNGALDSQVVCALGKKYHVGHFTCSGCKRSLVGEPFYERLEKPWCGPCFGRF